jgi:hypothetical protein
MKKNVGKTDRIVRIAMGIAIISFGIVMHSWWGALGAGIMLPAIMGSDPLYSMLGINTSKKRDHGQEL